MTSENIGAFHRFMEGVHCLRVSEIASDAGISYSSLRLPLLMLLVTEKYEQNGSLDLNEQKQCL